MSGWPHLSPGASRRPRDLGPYASLVGSAPQVAMALTGACLGASAGACAGWLAGALTGIAAPPLAASAALAGACALGVHGWQEGYKTGQWLRGYGWQVREMS